MEDAFARQDIVDPEAFEGVLRAHRFEPGDRDRDAVASQALIRLDAAICAAVKSISRMPLASSTSSFGGGCEVRSTCRTSLRKLAALRKDSGAWKPTTATSGTRSPAMCGLAGHQIVVPGTRSNCTSRARVVLQMPCSSDSMMPSPTPCSIGSTMMARGRRHDQQELAERLRGRC